MLILGLALSLAGLGPVPLSACALLSSKLAECAAPETQSQCDKMNADENGPRLTVASDTSCCLLTAPIPVPQFNASGVSTAPPPLAVGGPMVSTLQVQGVRPAISVPDAPPPGLQSLLCTFLI